MINSQDLSIYLNKFAKIFGFQKYNYALISHLKKISIPTNQVCVKELEHQSAIFCKQCGVCSNSIICLGCYEKSKEKHIGHDITFKNLVGGCCDCGNPLAWKESGFCSEHKGIFSSDKQIFDYLKKCFSESIQKQINKVLDELLSYLVKIFIQNEEKKTLIDDTFIEIFEDFMDFIIDTSDANLGILHLISMKLIKNYPCNTKHNCCTLDMEKQIFEIKNYKNQSHECICPFIKLILTCWTEEKKVQALLSFLHNYKLKEYIGNLMIMYYPRIFNNNCNSIFEFTCQIFISSIVTNVLKQKNFLTEMFMIVFINLQKSIDNNFDPHIYIRIQNFRYDIYYLIQTHTKEIFNSNFEIYKYMIEIFDLLHYLKVYNPSITMFQECYYNKILFNIENILLELFSTLIILIDYNEKGNNMKNKILNYIVNKISSKKEKLQSNQFSPNIPLIRAFAITLNNLCFSDYIYTQINLFQAAQKYFNTIENKESFMEILINDIMKVIGFIYSLNFNFFSYYNTDIKQYLLYFDYHILFLSDFVLLRYLISFNENKIYFTIDQILKLSSINNSCNNFIKKIYKCDKNKYKDLDLNWCIDDELNKNMNLNSTIISIFVSIIRNEFLEIDLFSFSYQMIEEHKIEVPSIQKLYEIEKEEIIEIVKLKIIINLLIKSNFSSYSEILEFFEQFYISILGENTIKDIILNMTEKRVLNNGKIKYILKDEYLHQFDLDLIFSRFLSAKIERYLIDFQSENFCLLNTKKIIKSLKCENELLFQNFKNFFLNGTNLISILNLIKAILQNENFNCLETAFLSKLLKIVCDFITIAKSNDNFDINVSYKDNLSELLKVLVNASNKTNFRYKSLTLYLQNEIINYLNINDESNNITLKEDKSNTSNVEQKKLSMKEKLKKKFKDKNKEIENKFKDFIKEIENANNDNENICILCKKTLLKEEYEKTNYGKFGYFESDNFLSISIENTIFKEFNNIKPKIKWNNFYHSEKEKNIKIFSCNHLIHNECFIQYSINNNHQLFWNSAIYCPYCKLHSNIWIPSFNTQNNKKIYKGLKFDDILSNKNGKFELKQLNSINGFKLDESEEDSIDIYKSTFFLDELIQLISDSVHILESLLNPELMNKYFSIFEKEFSNFLLYYHLIEDKNQQIEIWSSIILSWRIVLKTFLKKNQIQSNNLFYLLNYGLINDFKLILNDDFSLIFGKFLFNYLIFCDELEEDMQYILNKCSPYISLIAFFKKQFLEKKLENLNKEDIEYSNYEKFISSTEESNNNLMKSIFNSYLNKAKIAYLIQSKIKNKTPISDNNYEIFKLSKYENLVFYKFIFDFNFQNPPKYMKSLKLILKDYIIKNFLFEITKKDMILKINPLLLISGLDINFNFYKLPSNLFEFASNCVNEKCIGCGKSGIISLLCLICGKKMCDSNNCKTNTNIVTILSHIETCNGNCIPIIRSSTGEICFFYQKKIISSGIWVYLNNLGEIPESYGTINSDYQINESEIHKCEKMFINYSFRK